MQSPPAARMPPHSARAFSVVNPVSEVLGGTPASIAVDAAARHAAAGPRWIAGAGCEIPAATPYENVEALVAYARAHRP